MGFVVQGSNSGFNPLTFEDLFAPVREYMNVYDKVNEEYSNLVDMTEKWRDIANQEKSPEAYSMFRAYADQLDSYASDFAQNGLNSRNRRGLMGMKSGYASNISPIEKASDAMNEANRLRDEAGSDAIFEVSRYNSIDNFLHGETANNKRESRQDIQTRTAQQIQAAVQSMLDRPEIRDSLSPQFLEVITGMRGNDMNALMRAIENDPTANNIFTQIKAGMMNEIGMDRFDSEGKRAVEGAINQGLYSGLDNIQVQLMQNGEYMSKRDRDASALAWASYNLEKDKWDTAKKQSTMIPLTGPDGMPSGDYWDTKIKKVVDADGNIIRDKIDPSDSGSISASGFGESPLNMSDTAKKTLLAGLSKPLYFDAAGLTGNAGHDETAYYSFQGAKNEGAEHNFSLLTGKAKTRALNYIGNLLGLQDFAKTYYSTGMSNKQREQIDQILDKNVRVWRDQDWFSDNHFAVYLRGTDYKGEGGIGNEAEMLAAYQALLDIKGKAINANNVTADLQRQAQERAKAKAKAKSKASASSASKPKKATAATPTNSFDFDSLQSGGLNYNSDYMNGLIN